MRMQIRTFSELTGVSVRTLHYYDEIGLLEPASVDGQTGYRFYDETSLARMQEILFYRELGFSLRNISAILSSPSYDKQAALSQQKQLLVLKKERLERIIAAVDDAMKGETNMTAFNDLEFEKKRKEYEQEAKEKWGHTDAYAEYETKISGHSKAQSQSAVEGLNRIFADFAVCMKSGAVPDSAEAQELVKELQAYITEHFYLCTKEILSGLGQMYIGDVRFKSNIDSHGDGTAEFTNRAIQIFCK